MVNSDRNIVAKALFIDIIPISRPKTSVRSFPLARLSTFMTAKAIVLVLIPPPVELGEAPIHINSITKMIVENCSAPKSILLNPAVLGVVAVEKAITNFPIP